MAVETPICNFGWKAADFELIGVDGKAYSLANLNGRRGLLVMFICNHCPYVRAILPRIIRDTTELAELGINSAAICSNDPEQYPEDSFERMHEMAMDWQFPFPYLHDRDQSVARAYGAVCTPDFFGFNADLELQYRGRLDASTKELGPPDLRRDLFLAMQEVADTGTGPREQIPSMGCSIKWIDEAA